MYKHPLAFLLYFIDETYRKINPDLISQEDFNWSAINELAEKNKVIYQFLCSIKENNPHLLQKFGIHNEDLGEFETKIRLVDKSIDFVVKSLKEAGIDCLLVKTYKNFPYITQDIDIFIKEGTFKTVTDILRQNGARKVKLSLPNRIVFKVLYQPEEIYTKFEGINIDVYRDLSWIRMPAFEQKFLWFNPRKIEYNGLNFSIPNFEADLLSLVAHSLFWHGEILLIDFLYLGWLLEKRLDWNLIYAQAESYGWLRGLKKFLAEIRLLQEKIYDSRGMDIIFPYRLSFSEILLNYKHFIANSGNFMVPLVYAQILFQMCILFRERTRDG
ncbi:MAG: nucleotidyltransferase family protein [Candidatus Omnitrophota bacterium]